MPEVIHRQDAESFLQRLENGELRAAVRTPDGEWCVDSEVKQTILQIFKQSPNRLSHSNEFPFHDREWLWPQATLPRNIRVVPGGSAIRRGAFVAEGVVIMPPSYINVGAYVDSGTMIDSHVLVGSCAQIGKGVHLSAGAQIGGVLEPIGALPVIVEDDAFVGGLCGLFEGVRIGRGAVLAAGVVLTGRKPVFDLVTQTKVEPNGGILSIPAGAVVVNGSRNLVHPFARENGLATEVALIVKYRDSGTDARVELEDALREPRK